VEQDDAAILERFFRDPAGLRGRLAPADQRQLDFLLGLYAEGGGERRAEGISRAVAAHLRLTLPPAAQEAATRRFAPAEIDQLQERLVARYGPAPVRLGPATAGASTGGAGPAPEEIFREAARRLLAARSLSPEDLRGLADGADPGHRHLIRLSLDGAPARLPAFQFDEAGRAEEVVLRINEMLNAARDPWGVADWWLGPDPWLRVPPAELLRRGLDGRLVAAAQTVRGEV
jgi:hypothetical protein